MMSYEQSSRRKIKAQAELERRRRIRARRAEELAVWHRIARPEQLPPDDDEWLVWYIQAGRGWGKTRTGAEYVYEQSEYVSRIAIVAESFGDGRDLCMEGESGIKTLHPSVHWNRSLGEMTFPSGAKGKIYSAEDPESLRGPNNSLAWCDEIGKWRYGKETWDILMMTMRLGVTPRVVITTTPRPSPLLSEIKARPTTRLVRGRTYDNIANLSPVFISDIIRPYEGTLQGRQELEAEDIDDNPAALWSSALIDANRVYDVPELVRVVTAVDPSATAGGNEAGVITGGIGVCDCKGKPELHGFVLSDDSVRASPEYWSAAAVAAYHKFDGDTLVAEVNNGGEMVRVTIGTIPKSPPVKMVSASRGKYTRAEPISMLSQQGKIHFVGMYPELEMELRSWVPGSDSPNRLDAFVWCMTELMLNGIAMQGIMRYYEDAVARQKERENVHAPT